MSRILLFLSILLSFPARAAVPDLPSDPWGVTQAAVADPALAQPTDRANFGTVRDRREGRRLYHLGNGIAFTGIGLAAAGAGLWGWIAATCTDPYHGCAFAYLGAATITFLPAMVLMPAGSLLSTAGVTRMDVGVNLLAHRVFLGSLAFAAAGLGVGALAPGSPIGPAMLMGGAGLALLASTTQLAVNLATRKRPRRLTAAPTLVAPGAPGLALAARW